MTIVRRYGQLLELYSMHFANSRQRDPESICCVAYEPATIAASWCLRQSRGSLTCCKVKLVCSPLALLSTQLWWQMSWKGIAGGYWESAGLSDVATRSAMG